MSELKSIKACFHLIWNLGKKPRLGPSSLLLAPLLYFIINTDNTVSVCVPGETRSRPAVLCARVRGGCVTSQGSGNQTLVFWGAIWVLHLRATSPACLSVCLSHFHALYFLLPWNVPTMFLTHKSNAIHLPKPVQHVKINAPGLGLGVGEKHKTERETQMLTPADFLNYKAETKPLPCRFCEVEECVLSSNPH